MALKGSLKDLSIENIFQAIFMEKKGGRLVVTSGKKTISVFFKEGKILHAEEGEKKDNVRIKRVLIKNQYLTGKQWDRMVKQGERDFQSVWIFLARYFEENTQAFFFLHQRHIEHLFFNLLQWNKGEYEYHPEEGPALDKKLFKPMEGEFLLMEGYRIIDEWKKLATKLPQMATKISTSPEYKQLLAANKIQLEDNDRYTLSIVDQPLTLSDLLDSSQISICETGKSVERLLASGILTALSEEKVSGSKVRTSPHRRRNHAVIGLIFVCVFLGVFIRLGSLNLVFPPNQLLTYYKEVLATEAMNKIVKSLKFYTSLKGDFPESLNSLVKEGYLSGKEVLDPWGRPFILEKNGRFYALSSRGFSPDDPGDDIYFEVDN